MAEAYANQRPFYYPSCDLPAPKILFIQHFNLLCDERMEIWKSAIEQNVKPGDNVVELGSGTGMLSMLAARQAKHVWSVELDPYLAHYSREVIKANGLEDKITVINSDARNVELPVHADVLICEMLDTGLIKEQQVQVMNMVLDTLVHENTRIIPNRVLTYLLLSYTDYDFYGCKMPLPYFETMEVRKTKRYFSEPFLYHTINLTKKNSTTVKVNMEIPASASGEVNSLKMITDVTVCDEKLCGPSHWFNPPLVVPIEPIQVQKGDVVAVNISYELGQGLRTLDYGAWKK